MLKIPKVLLITLAAAWFGVGALAQTPAPAAAQTTPAPSATATPPPGPTPVSLADVTAQILAAEQDCSRIDAELTLEKSLATTNSGLSGIVATSLAEGAKKLAAGPSLDEVCELETRWKGIEEAHSAAYHSLTERVTRCETQIKTLSDLEKKWTDQKAALVKNDNGTPKELRDRMDALTTTAKKTREAVQKRRAELVLLLPQAQKEEGQIDEMIASIKKARPQAVGRLFERESVPIWSEPLHLSAGFDFAQESRTAWSKQWTALAAYTQTRSVNFLTHGFLFVALLSLLYWARHRVRAWADDEPSLKRAALVFEVPISMAIAFSLLAAVWIYPEAPRLLAAIGGAAALIPAILILRRLVDRHLFPVLNAMVVFYFLDQLRTVAAAVPVAARLLFIAEMAGGVLLLAWLLWSGRLAASHEQDEKLAKVTAVGARLTLGCFLAAFLANSIGCANLGNLLGNAVLKSAYLAVVLYAATRVADGLIIGGLSTKPLSNLGGVRGHRKLIWHRTHRTFEFAALFIWFYGTLDLFSLRTPVVEKIRGFLFVWNETGNQWKLDLTLTGQLLAFGVVVWAAFLLSRFLRFILEEDFYPRIQIERGLSYAVSTMLHYAILLLGFYIAASTAGIDMTKFTILAGAFGVGMGFGLQNIINNFVSGIILLFERPVKVGDVVQMNDAAGVVDRIGIRASIIRTGNGSEIIVPNGKLISDQVINWTLSNRKRAIELPVAVPSNVDPCRVIEILTSVAKAHPSVNATPVPNAQLTDLGADALQFKLSVWTDRIEQWTQFRSDLAVAINAEFIKEGIRKMPPVVPA